MSNFVMPKNKGDSDLVAHAFQPEAENTHHYAKISLTNLHDIDTQRV